MATSHKDWFAELHLILSTGQEIGCTGKVKVKVNYSHGQYSCKHRLYDVGVDAHLPFHGLEPAVGLHPALWTVDHTSSTTCRYLPGFYTGAKLYCLVTEAHGREQLAQSCYLVAAQPGIEPMTFQSRVWRPNRYATKMHRACLWNDRFCIKWDVTCELSRRKWAAYCWRGATVCQCRSSTSKMRSWSWEPRHSRRRSRTFRLNWRNWRKNATFTSANSNGYRVKTRPGRFS